MYFKIFKKNNLRPGFLAQSSVLAALALFFLFGRPFINGGVDVYLNAPRESILDFGVLEYDSDFRYLTKEKFFNGYEVNFSQAPKDQRVANLEKYLQKHHSPLASYAELIVSESDKYGIPYKMVVAIAYHESGLCRKCFKPYNCWGWMTKETWGSYDEAIPKYIKGLYKGYFSKGADTIEEIAPNYVMTDKWPDFVIKIKELMAKIP